MHRPVGHRHGRATGPPCCCPCAACKAEATYGAARRALYRDTYPDEKRAVPRRLCRLFVLRFEPEASLYPCSPGLVVQSIVEQVVPGPAWLVTDPSDVATKPERSSSSIATLSAPHICSGIVYRRSVDVRLRSIAARRQRRNVSADRIVCAQNHDKRIGPGTMYASRAVRIFGRPSGSPPQLPVTHGNEHRLSFAGRGKAALLVKNRCRTCSPGNVDPGAPPSCFLLYPIGFSHWERFCGQRTTFFAAVGSTACTALFFEPLSY